MRALLMLMLVFGVSGCGTNQWAEPRDTGKTDRLLEGTGPMDRTATIPSAETAMAVDALAESLLAAVPEGESVGCLPLVMLDLQKEGPWVSELGVSYADLLTQELRKKRATEILGATDLGLLAGRANVGRSTLRSLDGVRKFGVRFGVDTVVFGTIKHDRNAAGVGLDTLSFTVSAYSFGKDRVVAEKRHRISNRTPGSAFEWNALARDSAWLPESSFKPQRARPNLTDEMRVACEILAKRLARGFADAPKDAKTYVAPCDVASFVAALAQLRGAQMSFTEEYEARIKAAAGGNPLLVDRPLELGGASFANLQSAKDYLTTLDQTLRVSRPARFGQSLSQQLIEALGEAGKTRSALVADLGFTEWSDTQLVNGELALGGLVRSKVARDLLMKNGYRFVIAPRLDKLAGHFVLRVSMHDLEKKNVVASAHFAIQDSFSAALSKELEQTKLQKIGSLPKLERQSWADIYDQTVKSVVQVASKKGWGSGFLVSGKGHVITNQHVVDGIAASDAPVLIFADGSRSAYRVLKMDKAWDLAVLVAESPPTGAPFLRFATPKRARVGTPVAVLGRPKQTQSWVLAPGYLSSNSEVSRARGTARYMYTSPTRGGNSGSPVLLQDGSVLAVHSEGTLGYLTGAKAPTELTGFAKGVPSARAAAILAAAMR